MPCERQPQPPSSAPKPGGSAVSGSVPPEPRWRRRGWSGSRSRPRPTCRRSALAEPRCCPPGRRTADPAARRGRTGGRRSARPRDLSPGPGSARAAPACPRSAPARRPPARSSPRRGRSSTRTRPRDLGTCRRNASSTSQTLPGSASLATSSGAGTRSRSCGSASNASSLAWISCQNGDNFQAARLSGLTTQRRTPVGSGGGSHCICPGDSCSSTGAPSLSSIAYAWIGWTCAVAQAERRLELEPVVARAERLAQVVAREVGDHLDRRGHRVALLAAEVQVDRRSARRACRDPGPTRSASRSRRCRTPRPAACCRGPSAPRTRRPATCTATRRRSRPRRRPA
jgi:hypothetical protein